MDPPPRSLSSVSASLHSEEDGGSPRVRPVLMRLACRYLLLERQGRRQDRPLDPVMRFHVGNGAEVHRVNFGADSGRRGLSQSFGMMVNYEYVMDRVDENRALYASTGRIPRDSEVEQWAFDSATPRSKL